MKPNATSEVKNDIKARTENSPPIPTLRFARRGIRDIQDKRLNIAAGIQEEMSRHHWSERNAYIQIG